MLADIASAQPVSIAVEPADQLDVRSMIAELEAYLFTLTPREQCHHMSADQLAAEATVFVARSGGAAIGLGALRLHPDAVGEVKRMYVRPDRQGRGTGSLILGAILDEARAKGVRRLVLETGDRHHAAWRVYEKFGFARCGPVLGYPDWPTSVFYARDLAEETAA